MLSGEMAFGWMDFGRKISEARREGWQAGWEAALQTYPITAREVLSYERGKREGKTETVEAALRLEFEWGFSVGQRGLETEKATARELGRQSGFEDGFKSGKKHYEEIWHVDKAFQNGIKEGLCEAVRRIGK